MPNKKKYQTIFSNHKNTLYRSNGKQNRDKEGTISLILNSLSSASHYILFSWSIYRCENISISKDPQKNRGKWRYVKSRGKDRCSEPVIIQNPIGGLHNSETISLVSTGLYGSYGFVVTMVVAEW